LPAALRRGKNEPRRHAGFFAANHANNKLAFITYPEKHKTWDGDFDGIEVFSLHTNAKKMSPFFVLFDAVWSYYSYQSCFCEILLSSGRELKQFDEITRTRKSTLFAEPTRIQYWVSLVWRRCGQ
jgi:hypothetical protein